MQSDVVLTRSDLGAQQSLAFVLKVTERCNLACTYCYFFFGGDDSYKQHPPLVLPETIDGLVQFTLDAIRTKGISTVTIGFHGGEPLLLKKEPFARLCERLISDLGPHCNLQLNVQSNAVLIDEAWVDIFSRFGVTVGVSFDGPPEHHDKTRITKKGRGTYAETLRGWNMLVQAHAKRRIPEPGILCVVDPAQSGAATFRHFTKELRATRMDFLLPDITHDSPDANEQFVRSCGDYLIDVCSAWFELARSAVRVRFLEHIMKPLISDELCRAVRQKDDPRSLFTVSSNGELAPDDALRPLAARFREAGLSVRNHTLSQVLDHSLWQELVESQETLPAACSQCIWKNVCRGGLRQHRFSENNGFDNPSLYCESLQRVYAFVTSHLIRGGLPISEIERRLNMPV